MKAKSCLHKRSPNNHDDNNEIYHHPQQVGEFRQDEHPQQQNLKAKLSKAKNDKKKKRRRVFTFVSCFVSASSYGGAPVWIVAVAKAWGWCGLVRDAGHGLDGAAKEASIGRALPEGPGASPLVGHGAESEAGCRLGRKAAAQCLDLFRDEGGGGDVCVTEITDLLQGLACRWQ